MKTRFGALAKFALLATIVSFSSVTSYAQTGSGTSGKTIEDTTAGWTWSGMTQINDEQFHGGSAFVGGPSTSAVYTFDGTGVKVVGLSGKKIVVDRHNRALGSAVISIDGKEIKTTSLSSAQNDFGATIFETSGLPQGNHVLSLKAAEGWMVLDYIIVTSDDATAQKADDGGKDYLISAHSVPDKFVSPRNGNATEGALVAIYSQSTLPAAKWHMVALGDGVFKITVKSEPQLALTAVDLHIPASPQGQAALNKYTGSDNQKWRLVPADHGGYRICPIGSPNLNMTLWSYKTTDDTVCDMFKDIHNEVQSWIFTPA